jgi:transcriptional regulator with XRE-family HTH domain
MTLSERLGRLRSRAGLGNRELDRAAGISAGHSWLIENGQRPNPELKTITALANALGSSIGWLASGEGQEPTDEQIAAAAFARSAKGAA